jgi:ABC-type lipoprotein release transport system permease subunit
VSRVIRNLLYETQAADPFSIGSSLALLIAMAFVAGMLPAYRASNSDATRVLHEQ